MPLVVDVVLGLHVVAGITALVTAAGAIATEKGSRLHRRFGRAFLYAMGGLFVTAFALIALDTRLDDVRARLFLAFLTIFSVYFAFSGYRIHVRRRAGVWASPVDWVGALLVLAAGLGLLGVGVSLLDETPLAVVMVVLGGIGVYQGGKDLWSFRNQPVEPRWIVDHVGRMGGALIVIVTAVSTVNFDFLPVLAQWLWPTVVGIPLIRLGQRKYTGFETPRTTDTDRG